MLTTQNWAEALGVSPEPAPPAISPLPSSVHKSARETAIRAIILEGVVAKTLGADSRSIQNWFDAQKIKRELSPRELAYLENPAASKAEQSVMSWHCEAVWTLLWALGKVDTLGLPSSLCDKNKLISVLPLPNSEIKSFLKASQLRAPGEIEAEILRTTTLWNDAVKLQHDNRPLPGDLILNVLYERRYAFEWLQGQQEWDKVAF